MADPQNAQSPFAVIAMVAFGYILRTRRVPEAQLPRWRAAGWMVLICDSEMGVPLDTFRWLDVQSGPRRERDDEDEEDMA